ncbi:hypothetical protein H8356DRAFT_1349845 [Neocallimastix lanati (nom. inval.)]|nr:hypothetical protein H8356DRAFT_1349845 [Neocallimastix sp. JGI-2020a]
MLDYLIKLNYKNIKFLNNKWCSCCNRKNSKPQLEHWFSKCYIYHMNNVESSTDSDSSNKKYNINNNNNNRNNMKNNNNISDREDHKILSDSQFKP